MNRPILFAIATLLAAPGPIFSAPPTPPTAAPVAHGDGKAEAGAKDGANAIKTFKFDAGLKVELWANEPLLSNPVSFATDERGRWFVAESYRQEGRQVNGKPSPGGVVDNRGHMNWLDADIASRSTDERLAMMHKFYPDPKKFAETFETNEERIVVVEDSKGAGRADKSTIFADGFRDALDGTGAGILARGNDVWWTCIPLAFHRLERRRKIRHEGKAALRFRGEVRIPRARHARAALRAGREALLFHRRPRAEREEQGRQTGGGDGHRRDPALQSRRHGVRGVRDGRAQSAGAGVR
jgi:quinoprotein glucose dehydrogenase